MRIFPLVLAPVGLMLAACGSANAQQHDGSRIIQQLEKADANKDGSVSRAEFTAFRETQFTRMDRNKDGVVTASDIPRRAAKRMPEGLSIDQLVKQLDANGDGKISQQEFVTGPTPAFDRVDANQDSVVTKAELDAARAIFSARQAG